MNIELDELGFDTKVDFEEWLDSILDTQRIVAKKAANRRSKRKAANDANIEILYKRIHKDKKRHHMKKSEILTLGSDLASHMIVRGYIDTLIARGVLKEGYPKTKIMLMEHFGRFNS